MLIFVWQRVTWNRLVDERTCVKENVPVLSAGKGKLCPLDLS